MIIRLHRISNLPEWDRVEILVNLDNVIDMEPILLTDDGGTLLTTVLPGYHLRVHESIEEIKGLVNLNNFLKK